MQAFFQKIKGTTGRLHSPCFVRGFAHTQTPAPSAARILQRKCALLMNTQMAPSLELSLSVFSATALPALFIGEGKDFRKGLRWLCIGQFRVAPCGASSKLNNAQTPKPLAKTDPTPVNKAGYRLSVSVRPATPLTRRLKPLSLFVSPPSARGSTS